MRNSFWEVVKTGKCFGIAGVAYGTLASVAAAPAAIAAGPVSIIGGTVFLGGANACAGGVMQTIIGLASSLFYEDRIKIFQKALIKLLQRPLSEIINGELDLESLVRYESGDKEAVEAFLRSFTWNFKFGYDRKNHQFYPISLDVTKGKNGARQIQYTDFADIKPSFTFTIRSCDNKMLEVQFGEESPITLSHIQKWNAFSLQSYQQKVEKMRDCYREFLLSYANRMELSDNNPRVFLLNFLDKI